SPSGPSARLFPAVQVLVLAQFGRRRSQFGRLRPSLAAASALPIWSSPHRPGPLNHILAAALPSLFLAAPPPCCTPGRYSSPVHCWWNHSSIRETHHSIMMEYCLCLDIVYVAVLRLIVEGLGVRRTRRSRDSETECADLAAAVVGVAEEAPTELSVALLLQLLV
uniref:Uncharacterized protein n=1 Tax=Aegilops tauschii subsp. strangulata TaxID=200361 RepID=A0A453KF63_AEGTS